MLGMQHVHFHYRRSCSTLGVRKGGPVVRTSLAWMIGGDQGEGIDATGDVFGRVLMRQGYHVYGYRHFSSRIKGGHTNYTVRVAAQPVLAPQRDVQVLVALTQETIDRQFPLLAAGAPIVADAQFHPKLPDGSGARLVEIPLTQIARELGTPVVRNMVAVGASAALFGLPLQSFHGYVREKFARKGRDLVAQNEAALERGAAQIADAGLAGRFALPAPSGGPRHLMSGNDALALGAVAAGCRIMAAYPITPASDIMEHLAGLFPELGGAVCQMEDEIAAITLVLGANYAGARAMTATSGPGFSLMQEGIGLASMAEIPAVVVDCQRAGPSTGMPTKMEQSDLMAAVFGGHGEGQRIVLAPGTAKQAFDDGFEAFNLADRYQCPVIVLSDLALAQWLQTVEDLPLGRHAVDRGAIAGEAEVGRAAGEFPRYAVTESGISPRSLPGTPRGQYLATGVEHGPTGKVSEAPENRTAQVEKRQRKLEPLRGREDGVAPYRMDGARIALVCFGSTVGAVDEAVDELREHGVQAGRLQVRQVWPVPEAPLRAALGGVDRVLVVEQNATGELRAVLRLAGLEDARWESLLRWDGALVLPDDVARAARAAVGEEVSPWTP